MSVQSRDRREVNHMLGEHQLPALSGVVTGTQLQAASIPPLVWAVSGHLPEGLGILAARPKAGKSCLVLGIGLAVAAGKPVLGVEVEQRPVLYLALEDGWRRLGDRCRNMLGDGEKFPAAIEFMIDAKDAIEQAEAFVAVNDTGLIILDTLAVVKPERRARDDAYAKDYGFIRRLKALAKPGITVLVVHHTRKADSEGSFLDAVSGTHGIAGAADFVMVLDRKDNERNGVLHITGRDVEEASYSLIFECGEWSADGNGLEEAAQRANENQLGRTKRLVLQFVNSRPLTRTAHVVENLDITPEAARQTLSRLTQEGRIKRLSHGVYVPVTQSQSYETATSGLITARDNSLSDCHTVTTQSDRVTKQHGVSQRMSQSESPRSQGEHTDRDTVTRNLYSLKGWHSPSQSETTFGDIPDVRQDLPSSRLGPPKAEHRPTEMPNARHCEISGCDQRAYGNCCYGDIYRCAEHAGEWLAEQETL
ncbi:AAA family ATPase [Mycobacterium deserti]|uniref:AAA family ATPase n=1 Tax=Mycobacterium deserti TaxID=2978347 RepID=A0ABT2M907_9MYCO|nr:AAA family ATPase [Mycobacterium deserti]MCT7657630.1 AAA family ATPase [Mycobacterium deserti]